jgi:hypothetical protein
MASPVLTPEEVQVYVQDVPEKILLLDGLEFNPTQVTLCIELAISDFNMVQPPSNFNVSNFPNKSILLNGTLAKLFFGQAALLARNMMNYSDGGLQIPVEERYQYYIDLARTYQGEFIRAAQGYKISTNMEDGWGSVRSDYGAFPAW